MGIALCLLVLVPEGVMFFFKPQDLPLSDPRLETKL